MLEGRDFIILSTDEAKKLYDALAIKKSKASYGELAKLGILDIVNKMAKHFEESTS